MRILPLTNCEPRRAIRYLYPRHRFMLPMERGQALEAVVEAFEFFWQEYGQVADTVYVPLDYDAEGLGEDLFAIEEEAKYAMGLEVHAIPHLQGVGEVGVLRSLSIKEGRYFEEVTSVS